MNWLTVARRPVAEQAAGASQIDEVDTIAADHLDEGGEECGHVEDVSRLVAKVPIRCQPRARDPNSRSSSRPAVARAASRRAFISGGEMAGSTPCMLPDRSEPNAPIK